MHCPKRAAPARKTRVSWRTTTKSKGRRTLGVLPLDGNDEEVDRVADKVLRTGDRVVARLDGLNFANEVLDARACRGELAHHVGVGEGVDVAHLLERRVPIGAGDEPQRALLVLVRRVARERLVERLAGLAKDVEHLLEDLEDGALLDAAGGILARGSADDRLGVEAVPGEEVERLLLVVPAVDSEGLSNGVVESGADGGELEVEDVAVVVAGGEATVLGDGDHEVLLGQVGAHPLLGVRIDGERLGEE